MYYGEENCYIKLTVFAMVTSEGKLYYQITTGNNDSYSFQYFL